MAFTLPHSIDERPMAVIGAGTLGRRIALMLATRGAEIRLVDPSPEVRAAGAAYADEQLPLLLAARSGGRQGCVRGHEDLATALADCWLVMESIPERRELKVELFAELDALAPKDAILASNSSSYPSSQFIDRVSHPERVLNIHFMMPPKTLAVELMSCGHTDPAIMALLAETLPQYGLSPYIVQRESVGFIYNRIWAAIKREALAVVAEGVATPEVVDAIYLEANRNRTSGPCQRMDATGLDVVLNIEEHYAKERPGLPEAPRKLLKQMIAEGRLGVKSGRGFYDYGSDASDTAKTAGHDG